MHIDKALADEQAAVTHDHISGRSQAVRPEKESVLDE